MTSELDAPLGQERPVASEGGTAGMRHRLEQMRDIVSGLPICVTMAGDEACLHYEAGTVSAPDLLRIHDAIFDAGWFAVGFSLKSGTVELPLLRRGTWAANR